MYYPRMILNLIAFDEWIKKYYYLYFDRFLMIILINLNYQLNQNLSNEIIIKLKIFLAFTNHHALRFYLNVTTNRLFIQAYLNLQLVLESLF